MTTESLAPRTDAVRRSDQAAHASAPVAAARAAARFSKSMEVALADVGLSLPQYRLLAFLSGGPERATALAGWLDVSPPSLTALVDGAVARKLVERVASEEDRRCVRHVITDAGNEALGRADDAVALRLAAVTEHLSPAQAKKALEGLELLGRALDLAREARDAE
ncbi:MAG: MarR family winged helix-turn-helix transcriptional regulator, partial [Actinomycetota bacterium]|nr:MarR family winged helix-turn-helix transcriptional regulator [Actinomycetota bacterium]